MVQRWIVEEHRLRRYRYHAGQLPTSARLHSTAVIRYSRKKQRMPVGPDELLRIAIASVDKGSSSKNGSKKHAAFWRGRRRIHEWTRCGPSWWGPPSAISIAMIRLKIYAFEMWTRERVELFPRRSGKFPNALLFCACSHALTRFLLLANLFFLALIGRCFLCSSFVRSCKAVEFFETLRNGNIPEIKPQQFFVFYRIVSLFQRITTAAISSLLSGY